jgi:hypothetical protein
MNAHQTIQGFTEAVQLAAEPRRGRPTKFTPERMRQITNLVERGKSREEIAEIIGVTTGTLQLLARNSGSVFGSPGLTLAPVCCGAGGQVGKTSHLQQDQVRSRS